MRKIIDITPVQVLNTETDKTEFIFMSEEDSKIPLKKPAEKRLKDLLDQYDYQLPNSANKMRQYIINKLFEAAEEGEPNLSLKALEILGRVNEIGLFTTKIEISVADKPTADLEKDLSLLLKSYAKKDIEPVQEITDEELRGYTEQVEEGVFSEEYEEDDE